MQDDALDKILKDAAGQYHPAYNDMAWEGMHAKLDKHLPQKEDDRKWPWLLLPLLVTFIAAGIVWLGPGKKDEPVAVNSNTAAALQANNAPLQGAAAQADNTATPSAPPAVVTTAGIPALANNTGITSGVNMPITNALLPVPATQNDIARKGNNSRSRTRAIVRPGEVADDQNDLDRAAPPPKVTVSTVSGDNATVNNQPLPVPPVILPAKANTENKNEPVAKDKTTGAAEKKIPEPEKYKSTAKADKGKKQRSRFADNFALTFSAGPDYSFVKTNEPGEVQLAYGAGIAYTFAKRFTIRAGAYAAKKIYTTDSGSYNPNGISLSTYYSNIEKIKGDCLVYEVPVSLSYDFAGKNKHSWFGGAGISSFFMKRETYTYYYKRYGTLLSREYTINDQNNHLLSILTLSAGYRYRLSNRVAFAAEPYLKLPLGGVGFGNLKLKSGGVLFSAIVKPFSKRK
jgi:hypothetical protein